MATLTVTPGGLVPESGGSVRACVTLDAQPTVDVIITIQTADNTAQGKLIVHMQITILINLARPCGGKVVIASYN